MSEKMMWTLACIAMFACVAALQTVTSGSSGFDKEINILWEKYGNLKADVEELKAKAARHSTENGIVTANPKEDMSKTTQNEREAESNYNENGETEFDFQIQYASMNVLKNKNIQYVIEVNVPENATCKFVNVDKEGITPEETTKRDDVVRGILTSSLYQWSTVFQCSLESKAMEATYYFKKPDIDSSKSSLEKIFPRYMCKFSNPKHESTVSEKIIKSQASCSGRPIYENDTSFRFWGFQAENDSFTPIFSGELYNSTFNYTEDSISAEFSIGNDVLSRKDFLLRFDLSLEDDASSPLSRTDLSYYYPKAFDGSNNPVKPGTLAIFGYPEMKGTDLRLERGERKSMPCLAMGNPKPVVTWLKDGKVVAAKETGGNHVWDKFITSKRLLIKDAGKKDVGRYKCRATSGLKTLESDVTLSLCVTPSVRYSYTQNASAEQVTFQSAGNKEDRIKSMQCYNSTNTIFENGVDYPNFLDPTGQVVQIDTNINGKRFEMKISWNQIFRNVIPKKLYCWVYSTCSTKLEEFNMGL